MLLSAELLIEAVSDDFLVVSFSDREQLIGHSIWEVFPDNPQLAGVKGTANLRALLEKVLRTGKRQQILQQRYDVADPLHTGKFLERYWRLDSRPVVDEQGRVTQIIHSVTDITEQVLAETRVQQSLTREQAAYAEANLQKRQLHSILMQAPALICIFQGPNHVFKLVNPPYQQLVGKRPLLGKSIAQAMPELAGQPIFGLLDKVYRTGESFYAHEMLVQLDHENSGNELGHNYYNFIYQATRNLAGQVDGIMVFAYEVTLQVKARQQLEVSSKQIRELNEELQAINEELQASNEELISTNLELQQAQQALQELNKSLESLVAARTEALQQALRETQQQREQLREQQDQLQQI
ncbi:PAS domain-containing protein [Adhaeribacter pallidiroseus]|uniref:Histidine kinase n=1 Tax=Adhaeribacter pallidiroseus TaxID=2072847 RepID=A0A369Q250_9BACT|nr:PAS domain-containing protein [Adhaeribacter pallidiroseus]RDC58844.1 Histidine kinase [Adhaeribacter pallidiroseus]